MTPREQPTIHTNGETSACACNGSHASEELPAENTKVSMFREFQLLVSNLRDLAAHEETPIRFVGVTSLHHGVGVSTVAANLALAATHVLFEPVAVIDANLDRASLHECFATPSKPGLSDYLSGDCPLSECFQVVLFDRLTVVPAGSSRSGVERNSVVDLLESLEQSFGFVVVDLPPADAMGQRVALARNLDAVLLVLPAGRVDVFATRRAIKQLFRLGVSVRGTVLNGTALPHPPQVHSN